MSARGLRGGRPAWLGWGRRERSWGGGGYGRCWGSLGRLEKCLRDNRQGDRETQTLMEKGRGGGGWGERGSERNRVRNRNWEGQRRKDMDTEGDGQTEKLGAGVELDLTWGPWGEDLSWGLPRKESSRKEY